jgi:hypothetical protein
MVQATPDGAVDGIARVTRLFVPNADRNFGINLVNLKENCDVD